MDINSVIKVLIGIIIYFVLWVVKMLVFYNFILVKIRSVSNENGVIFIVVICVCFFNLLVVCIVRNCNLWIIYSRRNIIFLSNVNGWSNCKNLFIIFLFLLIGIFIIKFVIVIF